MILHFTIVNFIDQRERESGDFLSEDSKRIIEEKESKNERLAELNAQVEKKVDELEHEIEKILNAAATFAAFMKDAIVPYNDAFGDYLDTLINVEENQLDDLKDHKQIENLKRQKEVYEQEVDVLRQAVSNNEQQASNITAEDVNNLQDELMGLKHYGPSLRSMLGKIR